MKFAFASLLFTPVVLGAILTPRQTAISGDTSSYTSAAKYAQAAYCTKASGGTVNGATVSKVFGNGASVPYAYVAYNPTSNQIIVSHQG